jgi:hypothetical protein
MEAVEEARNLRVGVEGHAGAGEDATTRGFRRMVEAATDRQRRSLGQGRAARYEGARCNIPGIEVTKLRQQMCALHSCIRKSEEFSRI